MEFVEEQMWPLTSSTNCYTGACRAVDVPPSDTTTTASHSDNGFIASAHLATENHTISLKISPRLKESKISWEHIASSLPRGNSRGINTKHSCCVGYSTNSGWEALALMDRKDLVDHGESSTRAASDYPQQQQQHLSHQQARELSSLSMAATAAVAAVHAAAADNARVTTGTQSASSHAHEVNHVRTLSGGSTGASQQQGTTSSIAASSEPPHSSMATSSPSNAMLHSEYSTPVVPIYPSSLTLSVSKLVLRRRLSSRANNGEYYSVDLPFRPLAPTLVYQLAQPSEPGTEQHGSNNIPAFFGVWLASSDHNQLQFWQPDPDHPNSLVQRQLESLGEDDFHFGTDDPAEPSSSAWMMDSPVMALDCTTQLSPASSSSSLCCRCLLVAACQDGTIRLIRFHVDKEHRFVNLVAHTVIVDGPIVCLNIQKKPAAQMLEPTDKNKLIYGYDGEEDNHCDHVVVGSLCGYVCELYLTDNKTGMEGPFMVASDFWRSQDLEDSVLAVHALNDRVALGTQSGRCFIYEQRKVDGRSFDLMWRCQLPYSVHGIVLLDSDRLLVTTRRSLHLFHGHKIVYSAELAKMRLEEMCKNAGLDYSARLTALPTAATG